jgi:hypothetical protein
LPQKTQKAQKGKRRSQRFFLRLLRLFAANLAHIFRKICLPVWRFPFTIAISAFCDVVRHACTTLHGK